MAWPQVLTQSLHSMHGAHLIHSLAIPSELTYFSQQVHGAWSPREIIIHGRQGSQGIPNLLWKLCRFMRSLTWEKVQIWIFRVVMKLFATLSLVCTLCNFVCGLWYFCSACEGREKLQAYGRGAMMFSWNLVVEISSIDKAPWACLCPQREVEIYVILSCIGRRE